MHNGRLLESSLLLVECSKGYLLCKVWHSHRKSAESEKPTLNGFLSTLTFHVEWCIAKPMEWKAPITKGAISISGNLCLADGRYIKGWKEVTVVTERINAMQLKAWERTGSCREYCSCYRVQVELGSHLTWCDNDLHFSLNVDLCDKNYFILPWYVSFNITSYYNVNLPFEKRTTLNFNLVSCASPESIFLCPKKLNLD